MKHFLFIFVLILQITLAASQNNFSFVYLPDLHLRPDSSVEADFKRLQKQIKKLRPDFILTGGDMIYTAKTVNEKKAKVLFDFMDLKLGKFKMPVYYTMGNHETVGITIESGIDSSNPMWGKRMYQQRYGNRYKTFEHSVWKFFLLDGIKIRELEKDYIAGVDSIQLDWIRNELQMTEKDVPIVISIHTPLISPRAIRNSQSIVLSENAETVLALFEEYNLKMVLQGHNHVYMNLLVNDIYYISGGSTSYKTNLNPFNDGFISVRVKRNKEKIKFIPTKRPTLLKAKVLNTR